MNISEQAVEAAAEALYEHCTSLEGLGWLEESDSIRGHIRSEARAALEAAAPRIVAQALHAAADDYRHYEAPNARLYLRARAAELEESQ